jgi:hypothetical protein
MDHFNNSTHCKETTEQRLVSTNQLPTPRPYSQLCLYCFNLVIASAIQGGDHKIIVGQKEAIVRAHRDLRDIKDSAASVCQLCSILLKILVFFDVDPNEPCDITLRIPKGGGNLEMLFYGFEHEVLLQLYTCI